MQSIDVIGEPDPQTVRDQAQRLLRMHVRDTSQSGSFLKMGIESVEMALGDDGVLVSRTL